jgi:AAA domain-containing protein
VSEAESIAHALKGHKSGTGWVCSCPSLSHGGQDRNPSLSLNNGHDGKLLVRCHKGCTFDDVMAALRSRGLIEDARPHVRSTADIITGMAARTARPAPRTYSTEETYMHAEAQVEPLHRGRAWNPLEYERFHIYDDAIGNPCRLVAVKRKTGGDKAVVQFGRLADGSWDDKAPKGPMVPYRLPDLLAARGVSPVFIVEGEKDVETLESLGHLATTNPNGALSWHKNLNPFFAGLDVLIVPDADKAGEQRVDMLCEQLAGVAASLRVVRLPGIEFREKHGEDITDWIEKHGHTNDEFIKLARDAPEYTRPDQQEAPPKKFTPTAWKPTEAKDMEPRKWLYGTSFIRSYLSASFGAPGGGKSSKRLVEAIAMATGRNLLGITPIQRCRVWYWNGEDPQQETTRRVIAICMHYGISQEELVGWLFTDSGRDTPIVLAEQGKDGTRIYEPVVEGLVLAMKENKIDVLIVDPFVSCHRVVENDNGAIDTVAKKFSDVANQTSASVDIVHHIRKIMGREATVEDGRGAGSLIGAARCIEVLNKMSKEEARSLGVDEPWRYFCVDDGKGNMAPPEEREWFRFVSVRLGNGTELYPDGDNIGVVDTWVPPKPLADVTAANFLAAAQEIRKGKWKKDSRSNNWVGIPIARGMGISLTEEKDRNRVKRVLAAWIKAGSLQEYEDLDEQRKTKTFIQVSDEDADAD